MGIEVLAGFWWVWGGEVEVSVEMVEMEEWRMLSSSHGNSRAPLMWKPLGPPQVFCAPL